MLKKITGKQSGIFSSVAKELISIGIKCNVEVSGTYNLTSENIKIMGEIIEARISGFARNITIRTKSKGDLSIGCEGATDEDIAAKELLFQYEFPNKTFHDYLDALHIMAFDKELRLISNDNEEISKLKGIILSESISVNKKRLACLILRQLTSPLAVQIIFDLILTKPKEEELTELLLMNLSADILTAYPKNYDKYNNLLIDLLFSKDNNPNVICYILESLAELSSYEQFLNFFNRMVELTYHNSDDVKQATLYSFLFLLKRYKEKGLSKQYLNLIVDRLKILSKYDSVKVRLCIYRITYFLLVNFKFDKSLGNILINNIYPIELADNENYSEFMARIFESIEIRRLSIEYVINHLNDFLSKTILKLLITDHNSYLKFLKESFALRFDPYIGFARKIPSKERNVFVAFCYDSTKFKQIIEEIQKELFKEHIELWIAIERGPRTGYTENVFEPKILQPIKKASLAIIDISENNLNVGYEFGLAQKYLCPCILTKDRSKPISFDIQGHFLSKELEYDPNDCKDMIRFKKELTSHIINHFNSLWPIQSNRFEGILGGLY